MNAHFIRDANGEEYQMSRRYGTVEERLAQYTIPEPMSGCWLWIGALGNHGYPILRVGTKVVQVHRYVCNTPPGLVTRHRCHTPICVNPDHLHPGTPADNSRDHMLSGRQLRGVDNHAKLTEDDVRAIRASPLSGYKLGPIYGVHPVTISSIKRRRKWAYLE